jgi:hypothetical protein
MANVGLRVLYIDELKDMYNAENQLVKALPKMAKAALQPGPTNTDFFHRAGMDNTEVGSEGKNESQPDDVARQGIEALLAGNDHVYARRRKPRLKACWQMLPPVV